MKKKNPLIPKQRAQHPTKKSKAGIIRFLIKITNENKESPVTSPLGSIWEGEEKRDGEGCCSVSDDIFFLSFSIRILDATRPSSGVVCQESSGRREKRR
ncbi:hypothetical protein CDAR_468561 [Caerostris darwini]|uniref:Uncharacterized protein n=1 Tax=Caerostris darwini TaxID=1538125 RepID=A0AAV4Q497_9ARAC|nr:hypothetical protein CDAR_468561 [Caerostris darwini]